MKKYRIERIKKEINGVEYISRYVRRIKKVGTTYKACCPFHNEKTPSFTIYPKGFMTKNGRQECDSFYCFGCEAGGDIIKFKQLLNGITREEAVLELEKEFHLQDDTDAEVNFIQNELNLIKRKRLNMFSFSEVNLGLSIFCRKYLEYVKDNHKEVYLYEQNYIDHIYKYIDYRLAECSELEANEMYEKIVKKLKARKQKLDKNELFYIYRRISIL